jgi:nickel-dependent lactate racemase
MQIELAYGKKGVLVDVPDTNLVKVMRMQSSEPVQDPPIAVTKTLLQPIGFEHSLFDMAKEHHSACILICDITRPVPNKIILPPILKTLNAAGIQNDNITILIATGIHRPNLDDELIELVGPEIAKRYNVVNHYSRDLESHSYLGKTSRGTEVWIDKRFVEADFKIATGFIEPHLMAGFSGGRKLVVPGISSIETMKYMHGPKIMEHPLSCEGRIEQNPFHEEALEIANMTQVDFIVNVALNEKREIIGIFSGHLEKAHAEGVKFVRKVVRDTLPEPVDIVITTSAGYPLDTTFYQAIKGLTAATPVVKKGGSIILAAQCENGLGSEEFASLATDARDLETIIEELVSERVFVIDQWQFEKFAQARRKADIILVADGIKAELKNKMHLRWAESVHEALAMALAQHGPKARIAVIPKGPYILAEIE